MVESSKPIDFLKNAPEPTLYATGIYLFKVNDVLTRTMCEICSKLTIKTPEWRQWCRCGVFIVNFEQISHILVFTFSTLGK